MPKGYVLVWFRNDLRLDDNPALFYAIEKAKQEGLGIIPLYIYEEDTPKDLGGASKWWLHHSLAHLHQKFREKGQEFYLLKGSPSSLISNLISKLPIKAVFWNRRYEPYAIDTDKNLMETLKAKDIDVQSFPGNLILEPWKIFNKEKTPFKVFTAFYKESLKNPVTAPLPEPEIISNLTTNGLFPSDKLENWKLLPTRPDWSGPIAAHWKPGEDHAQEKLSDFLETGLERYGENRNRPDLDGTSQLSPYLHFGEISSRRIYANLQILKESQPKLDKDNEKFLSEIFWREFSSYLLFHFPSIIDTPVKKEFLNYPWQSNPAHLKAWHKGLTGYPIIDAGMRQLYAIGWMHNRVRMIVASFLIKDLFIHWKEGEAWFWDTLVDADLANNCASWQWVAGSGFDAAPYFRIFNPVLQAEKFDPEGHYVRKWVPELKDLPNAYIHKPWEASASILKQCQINLGTTYPERIVDHEDCRRLALSIYQSLKKI